MEAPEKIFICDYGSELGFEWHSESDWEHQGSNDIEYTRTDVFIEKACDFIKANIDHYIGHYLNDDDTYLDESFIEDLKKYMED